ncbi:uncharacterized protein MKK02DRAFT_41755 [Dioszegia hungarica]|uniref:Prefoldin n=1 Tax=Dioszegia hungarica TaxID=4972 RepID=A0AA38HE16_9TREE|nr:uncharacterized protein MKK02DRAFT_41755 [Dioszegia hungarica]KAI9638733.1 hypothetical protein MKK02DRAFT_41755 [Dioszegia hungarica]
MSNLSDDTLRKILTQIQNQAITSQRALALVRSQIQAKEKDRKILQLTIRQLSTVPAPSGENKGDGAGIEGQTFKGVGKMFVVVPRKEVDAGHAKQERELNEEIGVLAKKAKYLERQFDEANTQLKDIFHSQQREQQA